MIRIPVGSCGSENTVAGFERYRAASSPSPPWGEGWGEGVTDGREDSR
jgi:hypothetical protein